MRNTHSKNHSVLWITLAFIVWIIVFFPFLSSKLTLVDDALSYYDHIRFFVQNLAQGIFPLWDPFWTNGAPNDFFLRRLGAFNPFYSVIVILQVFKIPYTLAYLSFLALYYWGGMIAFYLLIMRIYNDRLMAYAGYLMLLFSSLGTRLFDSYMILVTVPLLWFFYFLIAFCQTPRKHLFLGLCLSFMTLASTYIPFYFFCVLIFFTVMFVIFYPKSLPEIFKNSFGFIKSNKLLVIVSVLIVILSFIPALSFFHNSNNGQIALPMRHGENGGEVLTVPANTLDWGAPEDLLYSYYFSDFRMIRFAVVYIPFFAFIVLTLGLFCRISRRALFLFTLGFLFLCCLVPHGLPFYDFLYKHVFFLKYFRNLHFFLWFALIPLFVVLVLEHWKMFWNIKIQEFVSKKKFLIYTIGIHLMALIFVIIRTDAILSTYVMIIFSVMFWILMIQAMGKERWWLYVFLTLAIVIQPVEVYYYLSLKGKPCSIPYGYDFSYKSITLKGPPLGPVGKYDAGKGRGVYYSSGLYNILLQNISPYAMAKYLQNKFILVDQLKVVDRHNFDFQMLEKNFLTNDDRAFVFEDQGGNRKNGNTSVLYGAWRINNESENFKILSFNANYLKILVDMPTEKFLIYNDSYDPAWHAKVNGKEVHVYQTNLAFKGVWLSAGKNIVEFRYGRWMDYALHLSLLVCGFLLLIGMTVFFVNYYKGNKE